MELIEIEDDVKRTFYEIEPIKDLWSVKELWSQISIMYFERMGLSKDSVIMSAIVQSGTECKMLQEL